MAASSSARSHLRLVNRFLKQYPDTCFSLGEWRRYADGIWSVVPELAIKRECLRICDKYGDDLPITNTVVSSVCNLAQAEVFLPDETFDSNTDLITFKDRTLVVSTGEIRRHSPTDYVTSKLPFAYDPTAESAPWLQSHGATNPEYLPFLQDFAGLCLTPETKYELGVWHWGDSGSGKSTFIAGLEAMLGTRCCTLGLAELDRSPFALSELPGKTLAVSTEQPAINVRCFHTLNQIISGEPIKWERKYRHAETLRPHVKLMWAMNELPVVSSAGVGIFRRIVPVPWEKVAEPNPDIKKAVEAAGQAVFNWAYEGLKRLNERGRFDIPTALLDEREAYRVQNDVPFMYLSEVYDRVDELDDDGHYVKIQFTDIYKNFRNWCRRNSYKPMSGTAFARDLKRLGVGQTDINGCSFYLGLKPKPINPSEYDILM
jgi:putative DNA primase/helicase